MTHLKIRSVTVTATVTVTVTLRVTATATVTVRVTTTVTVTEGHAAVSDYKRQIGLVGRCVKSEVRGSKEDSTSCI